MQRRLSLDGGAGSAPRVSPPAGKESTAKETSKMNLNLVGRRVNKKLTSEPQATEGGQQNKNTPVKTMPQTCQKTFTYPKKTMELQTFVTTVLEKVKYANHFATGCIFTKIETSHFKGCAGHPPTSELTCCSCTSPEAASSEGDPLDAAARIIS
ncbi:hypothetical protein AV530_012539 [Patagioenas fasciata monilis]|uniref:Uncharacterized protein n=1 Tax=Patagioenas fasciata monilis TaxID=372326 RepID=A0A1V4JBP3_PATFA|nr:hypothetical protein AV530_012539 [Patagioenas fasciata monilis]